MDNSSRDIAVTIICIVYNHAPYLRDALDSFINQKTSFAYQILVHDDASTDESPHIIQEYVKKYPNMFIPILQNQNQYSQGISNGEIIKHFINSKYVAFCEGDDYWINEHKLQKQYDMLESNPNCQFCTHIVNILDEGKYNGRYPDKCIKTGYYQPEIALSFPYCQTSSFFLRSDAYFSYLEFRDNRTQKMLKYSEAALLYYKTLGDFGFINEAMSCYRHNLPGGWTRANHNNIESIIKAEETSVELLKFFNEYTEHKYSSAFETRILEKEYSIRIIKGQYRDLLNKPYNKVFRTKPFKHKLIVIARAVLRTKPKL